MFSMASSFPAQPSKRFGKAKTLPQAGFTPAEDI